MGIDLELPEGFWYEVEENDKKVITIGTDESVKERTGAFIELKVPPEGTILENGDTAVSIVGTEEDIEIPVSFKSVVVGVNSVLIELQNVVEKDWLVKLEIL